MNNLYIKRKQVKRMSNKKKKTEPKKKKIFEKVNLVFRNPVRVDIMRELSTTAQRPVDLADRIGVERQTINYHLQSLKRGGLIKTHTEEFPEDSEEAEEITKMKGARVDGYSENGKVQVSFGVELTTDGEKVADRFVSQLYKEEVANGKEMKEKKNKK